MAISSLLNLPTFPYLHNGHFNSIYTVAVYWRLNEVAQGDAEHLAHSKCSTISVATPGALAFGFVAGIFGFVFFSLPNYPLCHGEEVEIFMTQFLIKEKNDPLKCHQNYTLSLLQIQVSRVLIHPHSKACAARPKQPQNLRSPHHLLRPASWIKLEKDPPFPCNFDIRLTKKI